QTSGGNAIFYVRSSVLGNVAMEVNAAAGVYRAYVYAGGKLVAQRSYDGQFYWMHQDHLGSGRKMTDATGAVKYRAEFDPYGQLVLSWSASGYDNLNSKRFTGYERDTAAGLDYANARMYSASGAGRFMQADPIGLKAANKNNPMSLNLYTYVNNDPINGVDPTGTLLAAPEENNDPGLCGTGILSNHSAWYQSRGGEYGGFLIVIAFGGMTLCNMGGTAPASAGSLDIGVRVPLEGQKLIKYRNAVDHLMNNLLKLGADCERYLYSTLGAEFTGLHLKVSLLQQNAFDGERSTIDAGIAGVAGVHLFGAPVSSFLSPGGAVIAWHAKGVEPGYSQRDVYYTNDAINAETILHETLHHHSPRLTDEQLYEKLGVATGNGTIAITNKLASMGCK
ncbi:MAG: RHS repeat-associated core domain-containing protein, partial [Blastocatellia bacterium]|nr:RHS repeat-associated core domain-containing protein [Blastocatellia bacterium]